jgi:hypothetical protein
MNGVICVITQEWNELESCGFDYYVDMLEILADSGFHQSLKEFITVFQSCIDLS